MKNSVLSAVTIAACFWFTIAAEAQSARHVTVRMDDEALSDSQVAMIRARMDYLIKNPATEDGPNCFNTAMFALGAVDEIRYSSTEEIEGFLNGKPMPKVQDFNCRSLDLTKGDEIEFGDIGVFADDWKSPVFRGNPDTSVYSHVFIFTDSTGVNTFEKASRIWTDKPEFTDFTKSASGIMSGPPRLTMQANCQPGNIAHFDKSFHDAYTNLAPFPEWGSVPNCEIFRCRPRQDKR